MLNILIKYIAVKCIAQNDCMSASNSHVTRRFVFNLLEVFVSLLPQTENILVRPSDLI